MNSKEMMALHLIAKMAMRFCEDHGVETEELVEYGMSLQSAFQVLVDYIEKGGNK